MFAILSLWLIAGSVSCQQDSSQRIHITIDDFLNSKLTLFPNQTVLHSHNLEEQTLENFKFLLDDESVLDDAYEKFKAKYGEKHILMEHAHHHLQRKSLFKENLVFIFQHNLLARMKLYSTFEMAVNRFADMHLEEIKKERLGLIIPEDYHSTDLPHVNISSEHEIRALPAHYDWREHNCISPVKDQLKCGACVMFAMTSAIEGHHAIKSDREIVDLSEQFMVDCAVKENGYSKNNGCQGNTYPDSLKFAKENGIPSEHLYPYEGKQGKCNMDGIIPTTRLKEYKRLRDNTNDVKLSVAKTGPVAIGIYVWKPFMFYTSGIYDYCSSPSSAVGGHAMTIVGFNQDEKYYIVKNQWGRDWGENGYIRYTYADARCGLEKLAYTFTV